MTTEPCAYIFYNGHVIYFDDNDDQIPSLNKLGLSGLKTFIEKYPEADIYWGVWLKDSGKIPKGSVKSLLKYIKDPEHVED